MRKVAVVYWSGTGNTEYMAKSVAEGVREAGAEAVMLGADSFGPEAFDDYSAVAFGCPAMGAEVLEESEFEPMFCDCEPVLSGKKIALFGSYGWGSGEWMIDWDKRCKDAGAELVVPYVICQETPDAAGVAECKALGKALGGIEK